MTSRERDGGDAALRVLNDVARERLPQVLAHVLERLPTACEQVFSAEERRQVKDMLAFSDEQVDAAVRAAQRVFRDAATFGQVDRSLLRAGGVASDVERAVDRVWRKKGSLVAGRVAPELPPRVLRAAEWQLQLEMGQDRVRGQAVPSAVFQLELADEDGGQETLELELDHEQLRALFLQLNAVQRELDAARSPVPPSGA